MKTTVRLAPYTDDRGNRIEYTGPAAPETAKVTFRGDNNTVRVHADAHVRKVSVDFNGSNGTFELGANPKKRAFSASVRVGEDSHVRIGDGVSSTSGVIISAVEGVSVEIGDDTMFASQNQVRSDDGHPIFDVRTGKRINLAQSIRIGPHTWLGWGVIVLGGVEIGEGTVVGANSLVTRSLPNNVVAVGQPAKVARTDIAWERPHLGLTEPFYKPDASTVAKTKYWRRTDTSNAPDLPTAAPGPAATRNSTTPNSTTPNNRSRSISALSTTVRAVGPRADKALTRARHRASRLVALCRGRRTS
ncbi:acyltransferase [Flexivirga sp. B27]